MDATTRSADPPMPHESGEAVTPALRRARLYHVLEVALAHPASEVVTWLAAHETAAAFRREVELVETDHEAAAEIVAAAETFFAVLRERDPSLVEADYISLFAANFPLVPCPPYGSLYLVDENKRLEEILAIKEFYASAGVEMAGAYDDLPDHLCAELELVQILCFREHDAISAGDVVAIEQTRKTASEFLVRFLEPFAARIAGLASRMAPENPYTHVLDVARRLVQRHLAAMDGLAAPRVSREDRS